MGSDSLQLRERDLFGGTVGEDTPSAFLLDGEKDTLGPVGVVAGVVLCIAKVVNWEALPIEDRWLLAGNDPVLLAGLFRGFRTIVALLASIIMTSMA